MKEEIIKINFLYLIIGLIILLSSAPRDKTVKVTKLGGLTPCFEWTHSDMDIKVYPPLNYLIVATKKNLSIYDLKDICK